jgi:hypothetical protein
MKNELATTGWDAKKRCRGVIVHEDAPTASRAKSLWHEIVHDLGPAIPWDITCKSAGEIEESLDFDQAETTDVLIVSVHDFPRFFFAAAAWLDDWLSARSPWPRALFILHDGTEEGQALEFLRKLAGFAGVTLLSRGGDADGLFSDSDLELDRQPEENLALAS